MKRTLAAFVLSVAGTSALASSFEINTLQNLSQGEFRELAQDLGAALSYKPMEPADPLGITGVDFGAALSLTSLANTGAVQKAIGNASVFSTLPVPTLRIAKGLPYNVDVGASYARVPSSGINLYGGQIKWAFLPGGIALPAVALRGAVTRMDGVSQMGFETVSADLSISKGFLFATPYLGAGEVYSRSSASGLPLQQVNLTQGKIFAGIDINLALGNIVLEADTTGGIPSYSFKAGMRF